MATRDATTRGVQAGALAYTVWGLLTFYWKQLAEFDPLELIGWRIACAAVVMAGVVTVRGTWPVLGGAFRDASVRWRLVAAALLLTVNWSSYVWTIANDRVLESALGYFMAPLGTMAIGVFVLHEHPTSMQRIAIGCAAIAVVIVTASYGRPPWAALLIAGSWSLYGLAKRQVPLSGTDSLAGETFVMVVPALVTIAVFWPRDDSVAATASGGDWLYVLGTGIVTAVPLALFGLAARSVPFTILGPLNYLVPTINFLIGWLWYDEALPASRVVGFAFVWVALCLIAVDRVRASRTARVPVLV
jgi:chloramphenicol-sensitive protein RarD